MDVFTKEKRSSIMSRIKSKDTQPEIFVRKLLFASGFRYRLHKSDLPGKPDIVLPKHHVAVFVNGCFWHRHEGCPNASHPSSRSEFWEQKLEKNRQRDLKVRSELAHLGWRVLVVWECACLKSLEKSLSEAMSSFILGMDSPFAEIGRTDLEHNASNNGVSLDGNSGGKKCSPPV